MSLYICFYTIVYIVIPKTDFGKRLDAKYEQIMKFCAKTLENSEEYEQIMNNVNIRRRSVRHRRRCREAVPAP